MDVDQPHPQQPYAILRIKRKRNEEPLDALVVDAAPSRKRSRGGINVFRYAGTVEEAAWNDEKQKKELEKRLAGLARDSSQQPREDIVPPAISAPTASGGQPVFPAATRATPSHAPKRPLYQAPRRTYTIVPQEQPSEEPYVGRRQANAPPKVWSSKELAAMKRAAQFKMYDAVPSQSTGRKTSVPSEADAEIDKFLPLLKDYLNVSEFAQPPPAPARTPPSTEGGMRDEYVYDVFYHRPTTLQELYEPGSSSKIAKLTGLPPELGGLSGEDDSDDEEYDDEVDEDSNAEDWHTNDYPEEEESNRDYEGELSDEFHERSDYDEMVHEGEQDMGAYRDVMSDDF